jgi:N-acetylglucosaminyldiphosphoundecaprenol N-acetyl-beta-D-mannosaminyltransferase
MAAAIHVFGARIDCVGLEESVQQINSWLRSTDGLCRYVVTPNVDHTILLSENEGLRRAYADASLVLVDGWPVQWAAKWLRGVRPPRVPGSDLTPALLAAAKTNGPMRVFLLGAGPGVAQKAARHIHDQYQDVEVVGCYSPPLGFEKDSAENEKILMLIRESKPDLLIVGLGAPKQEIWVHQHRAQIAAKAALCVGATIDFLAGEKRRAPKWVRVIGMEWAHRMFSEPRRLVKRYARDAFLFPQLVLKEKFSRGLTTSSSQPTSQ